MTNHDDLTTVSDEPSKLKSDVCMEYAVTQALKDTTSIFEAGKVHVNRDILLIVLDDTEMKHAHWREQRLDLLNKMFRLV
ncbi:MAG: hypothetical protein QMC38_04765 [Sinobacterium sp.]